MKKSTLLLFPTLFLCLFANAQDTIKVQALTWADNQRVDTVDFPDDPNASYRKILLVYNMRCHDAAVGNGNVGCREWDYSCNTFITDPTRTDSFRAESPSYVISNFSGSSLPYSTSPTYVYTQYIQHQSALQAGANTWEGTLDWSGAPQAPLKPDTRTFRYQAILPAAELQAAGLSNGELYGMRMQLLEAGADVGFFRIRMKNTTDNTVGSSPDESGLVEVYHRNTDMSAAGVLELPFYQAFEWTGDNVLVDISFTTSTSGDAPTFLFQETSINDAALVSMPGSDESQINFDGLSTLEVPGTLFQPVQDEITISFWSYGDPSVLPSNTQILDGYDANDQRTINVHLPWGNGQVYWDCGNVGASYDRINKMADPSDFSGAWNHWAFTKNNSTGEMKIFLNGQLWHSGTGFTRPINVQSFRMGQSLANNNPYFGAVDEVRIWNAALDESTVRDWMLKTVDNTHPFYNNLIGYYRFTEGSGNVAADASAQMQDAEIVLPNWSFERGSDLFFDLSSTRLFPELTFLQGDYTIDDQEWPVLDSVVSNQHRVISYGLSGTDLVAIDTQLVYPAGQRPVWNEAGQQVDSVFVAPEGSFDVETLVHYTKRQAKFEILSLVTPYGNGLDLGVDGKTFTFDVTDFAPVLRGQRRMSLEYGGENQEEMDIQFWFIKGTPEREVLDIQPIWPQARGGFANVQNDQQFEPRQLTLRSDAAHFKIRSAITGHGQNGEFVPRQHYININGGTQEFVYDVWKECAFNPIYPQGGTWIFDRAGWCPGMETDVWQFPLDGIAQPGETIEVDYGVNGANMDQANYLVNNQLVSYGPYNFQVDASVEAIVRPNDHQVEFERLNPSCNTPTVRVKNSGASAITSIELEYGIGGGMMIYTWNGSLEPQAILDIELPSPGFGYWQAGSLFTANILTVNGAPDGNSDNNTATSTVKLAKTFDFDGQLQLRLITNATGGDYSYRIKDGSGAILLERDNLASNSTYKDDLSFPPGCYTLEFDDAGNDGLSFWFFPNNGNGSLRFQRPIAPGLDFSVHSFNPDFGGGVQFDFVVNQTSSTVDTESLQLISTYPNPAHDMLNIDLLGFQGKELRFQLLDLTGRTAVEQVFTCSSEEETVRFGLGGVPSGMYILRATDGKRNWTEQVVVE